ncbi:UPF0175 family protein [Halochromatium sp.]
MHCLPIPEDAFNALKLPPSRAEEELRREFAIFLVQEGLLGPSQARTIADMDRLAFQALLARRQVAWGGSPEEAIDDMQAARAAVLPERRCTRSGVVARPALA